MAEGAKMYAEAVDSSGTHRQLKTVLLSFIVCAFVFAFIIILIYHTTAFYATAYPCSNITQLPRNATTFVLSMFNGYTEKVPSNANLTYIKQNIVSIRQEASSSVYMTSDELALAFVLLMFFSIFSALFGKSARDRKPWLLPIIFLLSLMLSQYEIFLTRFLEGASASGISLFFVDSLVVIIWFGVLDERLLVRHVRGTSTTPYLKRRHIKISMLLLTFLLPVFVVLLTLSMLTNLGLLSYTRAFMSSYFAHISGLVEFIIIFCLLFYAGELVVLIKKTRGRHFR